MIFDNFENVPKHNHQIIIFGSGPAGISLALKLEEKKIKSLIIEAGEKSYSINSQENYKSKIFGNGLSDLQHNRLRQFGGTSGIWGGWCRPIEDWNLKKWNLDANEIDRYSDQACKILDIDQIFKKAKLNEYFNQIQFQYSPVKFAEKYKDHISKSELINLCLNSQVTNFIGENGNFKRARIISNQKEFLVDSKFFILACGGIENSRILLWTIEQNKGLIDQDLPIGKYWMSHPWFLGGIGFLKKEKLKNLLGTNFITYDGPIHLASSKKLVEERDILSGAIYLNADEDTKIYKEIVKDFLCVSPKYGKKIAKMLLNKDLKCGNIFMNLEEEPNPKNRISLDTSEKDMNGMPITNLYYKKSTKTLITAKRILEEMGNLFVNENLGRVAIRDEIENLDNYENLGTYHHMGGTRIGKNKKDSVVNSDLKLHESKNLFITGSSVFTTGGYANPTYTIVKLSIRLADELEKQLKKIS